MVPTKLVLVKGSLPSREDPDRPVRPVVPELAPKLRWDRDGSNIFKAVLVLEWSKGFLLIGLVLSSVGLVGSMTPKEVKGPERDEIGPIPAIVLFSCPAPDKLVMLEVVFNEFKPDVVIGKPVVQKT